MFGWDGLPSKKIEIDAVRTRPLQQGEASVILREAATFEKKVIMMIMAVDVSHENGLDAQAEGLAFTTRCQTTMR